MGPCGATACASGNGACVYPTSQCSPGSCMGNMQTGAASCLNGSCPMAVQTPCAPYTCGPMACLASCMFDLQCSPGNHCMAGKCAAPGGL
jgi:hypothetical protein